MSLPSGYATSVGERGGALSGGQRQRIAIARTVLQNPRLLIMDEATSALDYQTERLVSLNLMEHFRGKTVLFITHRLNSIVHSDKIILMHQGQVDEVGTHDHLLSLQGRYSTLFSQQALLNLFTDLHVLSFPCLYFVIPLITSFEKASLLELAYLHFTFRLLSLFVFGANNLFFHPYVEFLSTTSTDLLLRKVVRNGQH